MKQSQTACKRSGLTSSSSSIKRNLILLFRNRSELFKKSGGERLHWLAENILPGDSMDFMHLDDLLLIEILCLPINGRRTLISVITVLG